LIPEFDECQFVAPVLGSSYGVEWLTRCVRMVGTVSSTARKEDRENKCNKEAASPTKILQSTAPVPPIVHEAQCRNQFGKRKYCLRVPLARWSISHLGQILRYFVPRSLLDQSTIDGP
jgi:hypothetical protein